MPISGVSIRIVDDQDNLKLFGEQGHLQISGECIFSGYLNNNGIQNDISFTKDGWFDTGDLALIDEQGLTIIGRDKDILIINGSNITCYEIEACINNIKGVRPSFTTVFIINEGEQGKEQLCVMISSDNTDKQYLFNQIQRELRQKFSANVARIYDVEPEQIEKTSIGKIQRNQLRQQVNDNIYQPSWLAQNLKFEPYKDQDLADQCFTRQWMPNFGIKRNLKSYKIGLFCQKSDIANKLSEKLSKHGISIEIALPLNESDSHLNCSFFDTQSSEGWRGIVYTWKENKKIDTIIFVPDQQENLSIDLQYQTIEQILFLLQAISFNNYSVSLLSMTYGAQRVLNTDIVSNPIYSMITSFIRSAREEIAGFQAICIDHDKHNLGYAILSTLKYGFNNVEIAYRNEQQYFSKLAHIDFSVHKSISKPTIYKNIMIFGGLGGIGEHLVQQLAKDSETQIIIVGRTELSQLNSDQENRLKRYKTLPAKIDYLVSDVCDYVSTSEIFSKAQSYFKGNIEQIFNLTGDFQSVRLIDMKREKCKQLLDTKMYGSLNLYKLSCDFCVKQLVFFSSVNGYVSGAGVAGYSAANRFQEAISDLANVERKIDVRCLSWSMWKDIGLSENYEHVDLTRSKGYSVFDAQKGIALLPNILNLEFPNCLIGLDQQALALRSEFLPMLAGNMQVVTKNSTEQGLIDPFGVVIKTAAIEQKSISDSKDKLDNSLSSKLLSIWDEVLDLDPTDIDKNIFDLGANSLILPRVSEKIENSLGVKIAIVDFFQYPTINDLALHVNSKIENSISESLTDYIYAYWQKQLEIQDYDIDENIFDLGVNSLHLPAFVESLNRKFNTELSLVDIFQYPTTHQLVDYLTTKLEIE